MALRRERRGYEKRGDVQGGCGAGGMAGEPEGCAAAEEGEAEPAGAPLAIRAKVPAPEGSAEGQELYEGWALLHDKSEALFRGNEGAGDFSILPPGAHAA